MNKEKLEQIKKTAKRTLKIIELIEQGLEPGEIVQKTGANRQLVDYYGRIALSK